MRVFIANKTHSVYARIICQTIEEASKLRGTGIAKRTPKYIINKMVKGNTIIALDGERFAGFGFIESWGNGKYVSNSGLIVHPDYRGLGLAKKIKHKIFELSRTKYPDAKIFSITTGLAVMKMNSDLGYKPVTFSEVTKDQQFWDGCKTCKNFDVLLRTKRKMCLCTALMYDPKKEEKTTNKTISQIKPRVFRSFKRLSKAFF